MVVTTRGGFEHLTKEVATAFGLPNARMVAIEHPLGGIEEDLVVTRAQGMVEEVLRLWTS